jgi:hypothetical protein
VVVLVVVVAVALVLVGVVVVGAVVVVVVAAVLADCELVAAVVAVEAAGAPFELPHALGATPARTAMASSEGNRFVRRGSGIDGSGPFGRGTRCPCQYPEADMDRSEELRQTQRSPPRNAFLARLEHYLPFWEPQLVVACAIALQLTLSQQVTIGPSWLFPALEGALLVLLVIVSPNPNVRRLPLRRHVAIAMIGLVSAVNIASLVLLCHRLLHGGKENGHALILSGIVLWCTNVLLFGLWYWEVDRGGPVARACNEEDRPDFLFVQMMNPTYAPKDWRPRLVDYLYLSFTNATAFSPTDTMPLTPTAKWLMSGQALASLVTVGLVVARAVNILGP